MPWLVTLIIALASCGPRPASPDTTIDAAGLLNTTVLPDLDGRPRALADLRGAGGVLLAFVNTRCPFASRAAAELPTAADGLRPYGITAVVVNGGDPAAAVRRAYAGIRGVAVVHDTAQQTMRQWGVAVVPTVVLLDAEGQTVYRGSPVWSRVADALAASLNLAPGSVRLEAAGVSGG